MSFYNFSTKIISPENGSFNLNRFWFSDYFIKVNQFPWGWKKQILEWLEDFENGSFSDEWSTPNFFIQTNRTYQGSYSAGSDGQGTCDAVFSPSILDGGKQPSLIEFYWQETSGQTGFTVQFIDNTGTQVIACGGNNPQWELQDGTGNLTPFNGNGYDRWIYYKFEFDWNAGTHTYHMEDLSTNDVYSGTRDLATTSNIQEIRFNASIWGNASIIWFDNLFIKL